MQRFRYRRLRISSLLFAEKVTVLSDAPLGHDRVAILCVPQNNHRSGIIQLTDNKSARKRQFRRQLKQAVALPS
jgi:hypothetical protein